MADVTIADALRVAARRHRSLRTTFEGQTCLRLPVQVVNEPGKRRRFAKTSGRTQDWKKAYVSLAQGQAIDYEARAKA